jgi:hypothetical protein
MITNFSIDGFLIEWGERLFYPGNRIVKTHAPHFRSTHERASFIRGRIEATLRRAPQVMVKVTGGGRGMKAIAAHFRYISKNGRFNIEDDRGAVERGKDAVREIERQWRFGGTQIDDDGNRREAFNIMLSMPRGTDPLAVQRAVREFAKTEFADHRYVMVLHSHQANPHVHLSVKAESKHGERLNPRKADLHRWREVFAERLRGWGVDAEATRQPTRGVQRNYEDFWRGKAREQGRLRKEGATSNSGTQSKTGQRLALQAWAKIALALRDSADPADRALSESIKGYIHKMPLAVELAHELKARQQRAVAGVRVTKAPTVERPRNEPDLER